MIQTIGSNRLDDTVFAAAGSNHPIATKPIHRLVVHAVHAEVLGLAVKRRESATGIRSNSAVALIVEHGLDMRQGRRLLGGNVLQQHATENGVDALCAAADAQNGRASRHESFNPLDLVAMSPALLAASRASASPSRLGQGPLALRVSGIRQLTARVRGYELRSSNGAELPPAPAGSHIDVPVQLPGGHASTRRYSVAASSIRRDVYEIAVLREDGGSGGSAAVHADYQLETHLHCGMPGNNFALHDDDRPALLIAGGIGITPIMAMAEKLKSEGRSVHLHYVVRSLDQAPYLDVLQSTLGAGLHVCAADRHPASRHLVADRPRSARNRVLCLWPWASD